MTVDVIVQKGARDSRESQNCEYRNRAVIANKQAHTYFVLSRHNFFPLLIHSIFVLDIEVIPSLIVGWLIKLGNCLH